MTSWKRMIVRGRSCGQAAPGNTESEPFVLAVQKRASAGLRGPPRDVVAGCRIKPYWSSSVFDLSRRADTRSAFLSCRYNG